MPRTLVSDFIIIMKFVILQFKLFNRVPVSIKTSFLSVYYLFSTLVLLLSASPCDNMNINISGYNFEKQFLV